MSSFSQLLRRPFLAVLAATLLALPARATWTIVAVNRATGEIAIAGATCLTGDDLGRGIAVVVVGQGVAAAQALGDLGPNRIAIRDGILAGWTPQEILDYLDTIDNQHNKRQYGIVTFDAPPVSFTGFGAGRAKKSVTGEVGELWYAIQGNVLTGKAVINAAEAAFVQSQRDLGMRTMDAMEAARRFGGDGRCSCSQSNPTGCGSPPPDFDKSAHSAFIIQARIGDVDGTCSGATGCVNGDYYLKLDVPGAGNLPDPVIRLRREYLRWRKAMRARPDHFASRVETAAARLVADGQSTTTATVRLVDLEGQPLSSGGHTVQVLRTSPDPAVALAGPVSDHGDGSYSFELTATSDAGPGSWQIVVDDGVDSIWLRPELELFVDPLVELHAGFSEVSASAAPEVPFVLNLPGLPGAQYALLGSAAGTSPGVPVGGLHVPLNRDRLFQVTLLAPDWPLFPGRLGQLDGNGHAEARLSLSSGALLGLSGARVSFAALLPGSPGHVTDVATFTIVP